MRTLQRGRADAKNNERTKVDKEVVTEVEQLPQVTPVIVLRSSTYFLPLKVVSEPYCLEAVG